MDIEMINPWTQVKSYDGHFERSQTVNHKNYQKQSPFTLLNYFYLQFINNIIIQKLPIKKKMLFEI